MVHFHDTLYMYNTHILGHMYVLETSAALPRDYEEFLFREPVVKRANAQINITRL